MDWAHSNQRPARRQTLIFILQKPFNNEGIRTESDYSGRAFRRKAKKQRIKIRWESTVTVTPSDLVQRCQVGTVSGARQTQSTTFIFSFNFALPKRLKQDVSARTIPVLERRKHRNRLPLWRTLGLHEPLRVLYK